VVIHREPCSTNFGMEKNMAMAYGTNNVSERETNITLHMSEAATADKLICIRSGYSRLYKCGMLACDRRKREIYLPNDVDTCKIVVLNIESAGLRYRDVPVLPPPQRGFTTEGQLSTESVGGICIYTVNGVEKAFGIGYYQAYLLMWNHYRHHLKTPLSSINIPRYRAIYYPIELFGRAELLGQAREEFTIVRKLLRAERLVNRQMNNLEKVEVFLTKYPDDETYPAVKEAIYKWLQKHGGLETMRKKQDHINRMTRLEELILCQFRGIEETLERLRRLDPFIFYLAKEVR
jgi:hypothetical protein